MQLKILLVEDDHLQRNYVKHALEDGLGATVEALCCEKNFIEAFEEIAADPPDLAVLDVMLMWARPSKEQTGTPSQALSPEQAGLRCAAMLRHDERTAKVNVLLYSVLPEQDITNRELAKGVVTIVKEAECHNLIDAIQGLYQHPVS
jgi:CheY-like chemotaxis protein